VTARRPPNANVHRWETGDDVAEFANRILRPAEVVLMVRYRDALSGRVLDIGCGAGRILGYLLVLAAEAHGVDVSPRMVAYCRQRYPDASVAVGDMTALPDTINGSFDSIFASFNVIDVLDDTARREFLSDMRARLTPAGLIIFSSHNLAAMEGGAGAPGWGAGRMWRAIDRPISELPGLPLRLRARIRNRQRLAPLERREHDHAILNDMALDYGLLHYYIRRDDQERQLDELGFDLLECLDLDGNTIAPGEQASHCHELYYVARRR
jgi:SAM-dependent methyltransferase